MKLTKLLTTTIFLNNQINISDIRYFAELLFFILLCVSIQKILSTAPHKKALLFCYMRGGSTFFSELFNQNKEAMFWYEPLASFYGHIYGFGQWNLPQDIFWHNHQRGNSTLR